MIVKLLTEHHLEFLSLKGGCRGSSESTLVKMSNCWKSHARNIVVVIIVAVNIGPIQRKLLSYLWLENRTTKTTTTVYTCS